MRKETAKKSIKQSTAPLELKPIELQTEGQFTVESNFKPIVNSKPGKMCPWFTPNFEFKKAKRGDLPEHRLMKEIEGETFLLMCRKGEEFYVRDDAEFEPDQFYKDLMKQVQSVDNIAVQGVRTAENKVYIYLIYSFHANIYLNPKTVEGMISRCFHNVQYAPLSTDGTGLAVDSTGLRKFGWRIK